MNQDINEKPKLSASLEGSENVLIVGVSREVNFSGYGLVNIADSLTIKNLNNNPITSIFYGIPLINSEDLIFYEVTGSSNNSLLTERSYMVMNEYEMIAIYFVSPILPHQSRNIKIVQTYKNLINYELVGGSQILNFTGHIYPILPYNAKGQITATFRIPETSSFLIPESQTNPISHDLSEYMPSIDHLEPFLENMGSKQNITIKFSENSLTKMEVKELTREVFISSWGLIRIKEDFIIQNIGIKDISSLSLSIPGLANNVRVSDDLGEIFGITVEEVDYNYSYLKRKDLDIDFSKNRVKITPNSKVKFTVQYFLPFEKYFSINWFQESIQIDILTTIYEFLGRKQTIKVIIEGCYKIESNSDPPDSIEFSQETIILVYESDYVSPLERKMIQFTFIINLFDMLLRPIVFILLIISITSLYVLVIKTKTEEDISIALKKEMIPVNEIREFCSLFEEINALVLEIIQIEDSVKRKKIPKKKFKNILNKNTAKIEEIHRELVPFKKLIKESNVTFEKILDKLDVLDAERSSINDSLKLLEIRYKRGRLPSKAAYQKLSNDFLKRRRKIERSIDKFIQQLRSYLL